jgi:hypothetical protein
VSFPYFTGAIGVFFRAINTSVDLEMHPTLSTTARDYLRKHNSGLSGDRSSEFAPPLSIYSLPVISGWAVPVVQKASFDVHAIQL